MIQAAFMSASKGESSKNLARMEAENSWLEQRSLKKLCSDIRRSLSEATKFQEDQLSQTAAALQVAEEESLASKGSSSKISFECGYAMFSEKHNCWILRHRGTTVAPTSLRKRNDSYDSLSCTGTSSSSTTRRSSLPLRNARRVAGIWPSNANVGSSDESSESAAADIPLQSLKFPPTNLLQTVFRTIELRSMFEQVQFSLGKDSPGQPQCLSRMGRTKMDFSPILSYILGHSSSHGGKLTQDLLQEAIFYCSAIEHHNESWVVKVDAIEELKTPPSTSDVPAVLASFIDHCLAQEVQEQEVATRQMSTEENMIQDPTTSQRKSSGVLPNKFLPRSKLHNEAFSFENKGAQLPGERSAPAATIESAIPLHVTSGYLHDSFSNQQPGQPSMANKENPNTSCLKGEETSQFLPNESRLNPVLDHPSLAKKDQCDERLDEGPTENLIHEENAQPDIDYLPENRASKRRKFAHLGLSKKPVLRSSRGPPPEETIEASKGSKKSRRSARTTITRWVEDGTTVMVSTPEISQRSVPSEVEADEGKIGATLSELCSPRLAQDSRKSESWNVPSSSWLHAGEGRSTAPDKLMGCPNVNPLSLKTESSEWVRLSHLGHVSDYHGFERRYAFLPLRWDRSLDDMSNAIEKTLRGNHFDETVESDEEVTTEKKSLEQQISNYSQKAKIEKKKKYSSNQKYVPNETVSRFVLRPIIFDRPAKVLVEDTCPNADCSLCFPKSETVGLYQSENKGTFREVEFNPLDIGTESESSTPGRRSRSREIVAQRKASLMMLNELRHTFEFISGYNTGFDTKSSQSSFGETDPEGNGADSLPQLPRDKCVDDESSPNGRKRILEISLAPKPKRGFDYAEPATEGQSVEPIKPTLVQLSHSNLVDEFVALKRKKMFSRRQVSTLLEFEGVINEAIDELPTSVQHEDILNEHKAFVRAIRTYSGKADQERIEKAKHEEERTLQLRELEYRNRGKKPSAEEVEISNFENRPALFSSPPESKKCRLGESCCICANLQDISTSSQADVIFHPTVKRVHEGYFCESADLDTRRSRTRERSVQQELAAESLMSLQHCIKFIEEYNRGWIVTNNRRN